MQWKLHMERLAMWDSCPVELQDFLCHLRPGYVSRLVDLLTTEIIWVNIHIPALLGITDDLSVLWRVYTVCAKREWYELLYTVVKKYITCTNLKGWAGLHCSAFKCQQTGLVHWTSILSGPWVPMGTPYG